MDYRELLRKYIRHVGLAEGANFIDTAFMYADETGLTAEEIAELEAIDAEDLVSLAGRGN